MLTSLHRRLPKAAKCTVIDDTDSIRTGYRAYLQDESRTDPQLPLRIYLPETVEELGWAVQDATSIGKVTVSGARTGITGGAVSHTPSLIVTDRIRGEIELRLDGPEPRMRCGAGTPLETIYDTLADTDYRYPVDPTEASASIGGTVATNASGARTLKHGPTRAWVRGMVVVLADGTIVELRRDQQTAEDGVVVLTGADAPDIRLEIEPVATPATKHNAGYHLQIPCDPIDLFIGSEGTLGIIAEVELALAPAPALKVGLTIFLPADEPARIVNALLALSPTALEYMDSRSIALLRDARERGIDGGAVPPIPDSASAALYLELDLPDDEALEVAYAQIETILESYGIDPDATWAGFDEHDVAAMKRFRHALPERINTIISDRKRTTPGISKIGTDMAVPIAHLAEILAFYRNGIAEAGIDFCMFGHIGNGHIHVNLIPASEDEWHRGHELYRSFAEQAVSLGGSVAAEHGLGRIKRSFLAVQYSPEEIASMRKIKQLLDPVGVLNPGVLFPSSDE